MSRETKPTKPGEDTRPTTPPLDVRALITPAYIARLKRLAARGQRAEAEVRKLEQAREQQQERRGD